MRQLAPYLFNAVGSCFGVNYLFEGDFPSVRSVWTPQCALPSPEKNHGSFWGINEVRHRQHHYANFLHTRCYRV